LPSISHFSSQKFSLLIKIEVDQKFLSFRLDFNEYRETFQKDHDEFGSGGLNYDFIDNIPDDDEEEEDEDEEEEDEEEINTAPMAFNQRGNNKYAPPPGN
jgi:Ran GTPase-activating protein (RanGAP) involved in mRNA processing and transport